MLVSGPKSRGMKLTRVEKVPLIVSYDGEEDQEEEGESYSKLEDDRQDGINNFVHTEGKQDSESTGIGGKNGKKIAKHPLFDCLFCFVDNVFILTRVRQSLVRPPPTMG